jgi:dipeptidyl aminopeptidase/acylaminoacyl peptidase
VQEGPVTDGRGQTIQRQFVMHDGARVEVFWMKPERGGPYPAILFIHGHQERVRNGGEEYVQPGRLSRMKEIGYVAAAISQPGYGNSEGMADFCGPRTQGAVRAVIDFLRRQPAVDPKKVVLAGYSRGAIVASMVAAQDAELGAVVLGAGAYDFFRWYPTALPGMNRNIEQEAGTSKEAFLARSAMQHVAAIRAPVLLLHGAKDDRNPVAETERFAEALKANGVNAKLVVFPSAGHNIPAQDLYREIVPYLRHTLQ